MSSFTTSPQQQSAAISVPKPSSFTFADGCDANPLRFLATAAGPLFTFALMWVGALMLRSEESEEKYIGYALIFENFPINRMLCVLLGWNDEQYMAQQLYGDSRAAYWTAVILVWLFCLPPLVAAFRVLENRRRTVWFAGFFILPFVFIILFAGLFLENFMLGSQKVLARPVLGIPILLLVVEAASLVVYARFKDALSPTTARSTQPFATA